MLRNFLAEAEEVPWDAIRYMTGQINYGGRVTDDWDRVLLGHILQRFSSEEMAESVEYPVSESGRYRLFTHSAPEEVLAYLETLPPIDDPEIFGMHPNASIAFQRQESDRLLSTVLNVQPRLTSSVAQSPEEVLLSLAQAL